MTVTIERPKPPILAVRRTDAAEVLDKMAPMDDEVARLAREYLGPAIAKAWVEIYGLGEEYLPALEPLKEKLRERQWGGYPTFLGIHQAFDEFQIQRANPEIDGRGLEEESWWQLFLMSGRDASAGAAVLTNLINLFMSEGDPDKAQTLLKTLTAYLKGEPVSLPALRDPSVARANSSSTYGYGYLITQSNPGKRENQPVVASPVQQLVEILNGFSPNVTDVPSVFSTMMGKFTRQANYLVAMHAFMRGLRADLADSVKDDILAAKGSFDYTEGKRVEAELAEAVRVSNKEGATLTNYVGVQGHFDQRETAVTRYDESVLKVNDLQFQVNVLSQQAMARELASLAAGAKSAIDRIACENLGVVSAGLSFSILASIRMIIELNAVAQAFRGRMQLYHDVNTVRRIAGDFQAQIAGLPQMVAADIEQRHGVSLALPAGIVRR